MAPSPTRPPTSTTSEPEQRKVGRAWRSERSRYPGQSSGLGALADRGSRANPTAGRSQSYNMVVRRNKHACLRPPRHAQEPRLALPRRLAFAADLDLSTAAAASFISSISTQLPSPRSFLMLWIRSLFPLPAQQAEARSRKPASNPDKSAVVISAWYSWLPIVFSKYPLRRTSSSDMMSSSNRIGVSPVSAVIRSTSASFRASTAVRCCPRDPYALKARSPNWKCRSSRCGPKTDTPRLTSCVLSFD